MKNDRVDEDLNKRKVGGRRTGIERLGTGESYRYHIITEYQVEVPWPEISENSSGWLVRRVKRSSAWLDCLGAVASMCFSR